MNIEIRTGSDSDIPKIQSVYDTLDGLGCTYKKRVLSAHRTPHRMMEEAKNLFKNGFGCCIAAAGGSAHLPGMTASETLVPVIALPVKTSTLQGMDSSYSMLQMPNGVPVGCVGIGDGKAAAELAQKIVTLTTPEPTVGIISSQSFSCSLLDDFGIRYEVNPKELDQSVVVVVEKISAFPDCLPSVEQPVITVPLTEGMVDHTTVSSLIQGPHAWQGFNRIENGLLFAALILGVYHEEVRKNVLEYRKALAETVEKKDHKVMSGSE